MLISFYFLLFGIQFHFRIGSCVRPIHMREREPISKYAAIACLPTTCLIPNIVSSDRNYYWRRFAGSSA